MRPLIAAEPMLRAESPETVLASTAAGPLWAGAEPWPGAGLCASALSVEDESSAHAQAARTGRIVVLLQILRRASLRRRGGGSRGEVEGAIVDSDVGLGLLDLGLLVVGRALRPGILRERQIDASYFLIVAEVGNRLVRHAVLDSPVDRAHVEELIRIEVYEGDIAIRPRDAQLQSRRAVEILGAEIVELVALGLIVDQRTGEVSGILAHTLGIVRREPFRILAALERVDLPGLLAVVSLHLGEALDRYLVADRAGWMHLGHAGELEGVVVDEDLSLESQRPDRPYLLEAAFRLGVLRGELGGGESECGRCRAYNQNGCCKPSHARSPSPASRI